MASLLVLRFENDEFAEGYAQANSGYIVGRYRTPTMFCMCDGAKGWAYENLHGWVVHRYNLRDHSDGCMKPAPGWGNNHRAVIGSAANLEAADGPNSNELYVQQEYTPTEVVKDKQVLEQ